VGVTKDDAAGKISRRITKNAFAEYESEPCRFVGCVRLNSLNIPPGRNGNVIVKKIPPPQKKTIPVQ